jgi:hypothetical protein
MPSLTSPLMHVVRKEEKEARLKEFVARNIGAAPCTISVIARAFDSPVINALVALADSLSSAGYTVQALIIQRDLAPAPTGLSALARLECRSGADIRFLDAHEQMLIGADTAWIGDCMRREPAKRDAFESYCDHNADTAASVRRAFERLWKSGFPMMLTPAGDAAPASDMIDPALTSAADQGDGVIVSTRH